MGQATIIFQCISGIIMHILSFCSLFLVHLVPLVLENLCGWKESSPRFVLKLQYSVVVVFFKLKKKYNFFSSVVIFIK